MVRKADFYPPFTATQAAQKLEVPAFFCGCSFTATQAAQKEFQKYAGLDIHFTATQAAQKACVLFALT